MTAICNNMGSNIMISCFKVETTGNCFFCFVFFLENNEKSSTSLYLMSLIHPVKTPESVGPLVRVRRPCTYKVTRRPRLKSGRDIALQICVISPPSYASAAARQTTGWYRCTPPPTHPGQPLARSARRTRDVRKRREMERLLDAMT